MSTNKDQAYAAIETIIEVTKRLQQLNAAAPDYAERRAAALAAIRTLDGNALRAMDAHVSEERASAGALRAAAEAGVDPSMRAADELERVRLVASGTNADEFARQAEAMLVAGQPRRAALMLAVAQDKGARVTHDLALAVETALDVADPRRTRAVAAEVGLERDVDDFQVSRFRLLATSAGMTSDGFAGSGSQTDRARASSQSKMARWAVARKRGEEYHAEDADLAQQEPDQSAARWAELDRVRSEQKVRERGAAVAADPIDPLRETS